MGKLVISKKQSITIGVILIVLGIFAITSNYFSIKKAKVFDTITLAMSELPTNVESDEEPITIFEESENIEEPTVEMTTTKKYITPSENYIGKLEIPKINLVRGFASITSKYNNVNRNIAIMKTSVYPDVSLGNFILAAHSGSNWNSFFNDLYKLKVGDTAYVYFNNIKYTYQINKIYNVTKTGSVKVYRDRDKTSMTLITCTRGTSNKQTVYIFNQTNQESY